MSKKNIILFWTLMIALNIFSVQILQASTEQLLEDYNLIFKNIPPSTFDPEKKFFESGSIAECNNTIDLSNRELNDENMNSYMEAIIADPQRNNIDELNLSRNKLTDSGAITIAAVLHFLPNLKIINIEENPIGFMGLKTIVIKAKNIKNIEELRYSFAQQELSKGDQLHTQLLQINIPDQININQNENTISQPDIYTEVKSELIYKENSINYFKIKFFRNT